MNRTFAIFLLVLFCFDRNSSFLKIEWFFKNAKFQEVLLEIQQLENSYFYKENNKDLTLWKARLFSLYPESFEISAKLYESYLLEIPDPNIYYELFLLYLDMKKENELMNLISGEYIPVNLIFDPQIMILRNFLECYLKAKDRKDPKQILTIAQKIKDEYLKNYCMLIRLSTYIEEKTNNMSISQLNLYNRAMYDQQISAFRTKIQNPKEFEDFEKNLNLYFTTLFFSNHSKQESKISCELKLRFPLIDLTNLSVEECRREFKDSLLVQRNLIYFNSNIKSMQISTGALFDDSLYQLKRKKHP